MTKRSPATMDSNVREPLRINALRPRAAEDEKISLHLNGHSCSFLTDMMPVESQFTSSSFRSNTNETRDYHSPNKQLDHFSDSQCMSRSRPQRRSQSWLTAALCLTALILTSAWYANRLSGAGSGSWQARQPPQSPASSSPARKWNTAVSRATAFTAQLNLTEKTLMVTGQIGLEAGGCIGNIPPIERVGFRGLCLLDGPTALDRADLVSVFPAGLTTAASWDKNLIYKRGKALGEEFRDKGVHVGLGPVAGPLGRNQLGGRNWEGFSVDPYLTGVAMRLTIEGMQDAGVQACAKHFIGNEQETQRTNSWLENGTEIAAISSNIDDRTLHELYLWPFADSIRAGVASIMCSYNRLNQTYACENSNLLNGVLKDELSFRGYVQSDWFATHSGAVSINGGLDMNMPGPIGHAETLTGETYWGPNITKMIKNGSVTEDRLDEMIRRIMTQYYLFEQDSDKYPTVDPSIIFTIAAQSNLLDLLPFQPPPSRDVRRDHAKLIRKLGAEATVLLKNVINTLPLQKPTSIGVFGNDAADPSDGLVFGAGFEIGTLTVGGGSGTGRHTYIVSPLEAIRNHARKTGARLQYILRNSVLAAGDFSSLYPIPEVCLVFLNTFASEGYDRTDIEADWNSTLVVENVARRCPNTVVITHSAGINSLPWATNPNVTAILAAHLPGQESGNSIVDVLWGDVNPSGKLPYSIAVDPADTDIPIVNLTQAEITSPTAWQANFTEGLFIDYRHLDAHNIDPLYEFGFGLSYTTFDMRSLQVKQLVKDLAASPDTSIPNTPGGNPELWKCIIRITTHVTNTGPVAGATVPQLYVSLPQDAVPEGTPVQVLRGFEKVFLEPKESKVVEFELLRRDVSFWDVASQAWVIPEGSIEFRAGFSSRDIKARVEHTVRFPSKGR
ncbi:beta-glucosidase G 2 [Colletotrichum truncatum]|uniref:Beta-glucosidase G 2 n=1 Tax=Colletotrichum truncatum TaxID=5467 RepID=A0ACC3YNL3_COLTU|nr:beta-glucosidase G 2 [Colletotrichum truncatum]XP_036581156.1 beta-glucosidase G 2 [Colletotrichum truncatum]KAF6780602.1 beta-glucosidase G 2 [Colletotrichum truncatum]KAF6789424.1 beta-glucosidase G 2 [Colletotrichum truncatum]